MIVGTGIDIAEVPRIRQSIERFGDRFVQRIFTAGEIRYCDSKANRFERYAARFAAKEAAMKALGTGWNHGVRWRDCEVTRMPGGRPTMSFHGKAGEFAAKLGVKNAALSLSHTQEQAMGELLSLAESSRTAYMCAERLYFRCHRMLVSDWLVAHGHEVLHIDGTGPVKPHTLTAEGRMVDGRLIYRGDRLL